MVVVRLFLLMLVALAVIGQPAFAQPNFARMVGGEFVDLKQRPFALLISKDSFCSGVLVGPREVLTAGHCLLGTTERTVWLGGQEYRVTASWVSSQYDQRLSAVAVAEFDVGLVVLDRVVTNVTPLPMLVNRPLRRGDAFSVYGFGTNERSGSYTRISDYYNSPKRGSFFVSDIFRGRFEAVMYESSATVCGGDSGGPATMTLEDGVEVVIGLTSYSQSRTDAKGTCTARFTDISGFFNVQSVAAENFLSFFPGLERYVYVEASLAPALTPVAGMVPGRPTVAANGRRITITMAPLAGVTYIAKLEHRRMKINRGTQKRRVSRAVRYVESDTPSFRARVGARITSTKVTTFYRALDAQGTSSLESAARVVRF